MNIHPDIMKLKCCIQRSMPWKIQTYLRSGIKIAPVWHEPITSSSGDLFETKCRRYRRLLLGAFNSSEQITLYLSQSWYENSSRTQNEIKIYRNWFEFSFWTSGGYADDEWQRQAFLKARIQTDSWRHVCRRARNNERASERAGVDLIIGTNLEKRRDYPFYYSTVSLSVNTNKRSQWIPVSVFHLVFWSREDGVLRFHKWDQPEPAVTRPSGAERRSLWTGGRPQQE